MTFHDFLEDLKKQNEFNYAGKIIISFFFKKVAGKETLNITSHQFELGEFSWKFAEICIGKK